MADVDATCSRFRPDSDLSVANASAGRWVGVDPLLVAAVDVARRAAEATDGLVNPLLGRTLVQLGYDRDFALLTPPVATVHPGDPTAAEAPPRNAWRRIRTHPHGAIRVPEGTALDLGSTGKAWAADLIAAAIQAEHDEPALVSVGGDVRISAPDGEPWDVAVSERPGGPVQEQVRAHGGWSGDVQHPGPPVEPRRRRPPPPRRPAHGPARRRGVAHRHRDRPHLRRGQHRGHGGGRAGSRRPRVARRPGRGRPAPSRPAAASWPPGRGPGAGRAARRMTDGPVLWYLNRGSGVVALVLLTVDHGARRPRRSTAARAPGCRGSWCSPCTATSRCWPSSRWPRTWSPRSSTSSSTSAGGTRCVPFTGGVRTPLARTGCGGLDLLVVVNGSEPAAGPDAPPDLVRAAPVDVPAVAHLDPARRPAWAPT